jgi:hypothetical protein
MEMAKNATDPNASGERMGAERTKMKPDPTITSEPCRGMPFGLQGDRHRSVKGEISGDNDQEHGRFHLLRRSIVNRFGQSLPDRFPFRLLQLLSC